MNNIHILTEIKQWSAIGICMHSHPLRDLLECISICQVACEVTYMNCMIVYGRYIYVYVAL